MDITRIRMTNEQYMAMTDDGKRYELHDGILKQEDYGEDNGVEMPSAVFIHNWIVSVLQYALMQLTFKPHLGYVLGDGQDYILDRGVILKPDVSFIAGRFETFPKYPTTSPDIAVEILSPSNTASEMNYKINAYIQYGSRLVWIVDPEREIVTTYRPGQEGDIIARVLRIDDVLTGGDMLSDFRLPLHDLFGSIPPEA